MEYISLSWYDIPERVVPIKIVEVITSKILRSPPWLGWPLWNICVTNDNGYVPLVINTSRSFPHSWSITGFVTRLTRRVPLVEQEIPTLPEHPSSPPIFSWVRVSRSLVLWVFCRLLFVLFSFGHCALCFSSTYGFWLPPFGIFKLFLIIAWPLSCFFRQMYLFCPLLCGFWLPLLVSGIVKPFITIVRKLHQPIQTSARSLSFLIHDLVPRR